jgi:hypothetical protein
MTIRKGLLALCMVGFLVVSALSMVGHDVYLPGSFLGELSGNEGGRLVVIRSAVFLTMAFFIFRHLRNKRPLSSVAPVQVFVNSPVGRRRVSTTVFCRILDRLVDHGRLVRVVCFAVFRKSRRIPAYFQKRLVAPG